jgi:hypothetical protein
VHFEESVSGNGSDPDLFTRKTCTTTEEGTLRILDEQVNKSLDAAIIYLTKQEAAELRDSLEQLLAEQLGRHEHISSDDYRKELTVCIYDPNQLDQFDERSKRLIIEDK